MDCRRSLNFVLVITSVLILAATLVVLPQATPAMAATRTTTSHVARIADPHVAGSPLVLEGISPLRGELSLDLPSSLPRGGPVTQETDADLGITKSDSADPVVAGSSFTYSIVVTNNGPSAASGVTVTDALPVGLTFNSAGSSTDCTAAGRNVTCNIGDMGVGGQVTRTIAVRVDATLPHGTQLTNTANVSGAESDPNTSNNSAQAQTTVNRQADLRLTKSDSADPVVAGSSFTYSIVVTNNGPSTASGVTVVDTLPAGLTFSPSGSSSGCSALGQTVTCTIGALSAGGQATRTIAVSVSAALPDGTVLTNTANVSGVESDPNTSNNSTQEQTTVARGADLGVSKSDSAEPVLAGTSFTYEVTVANNGPSIASGVTAVDTLPAGLTFSPAGSSPECSPAGQTVTCFIGNLLSGDDDTLSIVVSADAALANGAVLRNVVSVSGAESDPNTSNNSAQEETTINRQADLQLAKSASEDPVTIGTTFTYNLTVTNKGPSVATGVVVSDALPGGLTFDPAGSSPACSAAGQNVTCTIGALSANGTAKPVIAVKVEPSLQDGAVLSNTASVDGNEPDPNLGNNSATEVSLVKLNRTFLPAILRPLVTQLYVFNDNTGGNVTFTVIGTSVSCVVPNNATQLCGTFPPGTYEVRVNSTCGDGVFTKTYGSGPETTRVFCR